MPSWTSLQTSLGGEPESIDLMLVGGSTMCLRASAHLRQLFSRLGGIDHHRKFAFVFGTRAHSPVSGSAARYFEAAPTALGATILEPRQSVWTELSSSRPAGGGHREIEPSAGVVEKLGKIG